MKSVIRLPRLCRAVLALAFTLAGTCLVFRAALADTAGDAMLDRCIAAESKLNALQADFTLQGSDITPISGRLALRKPNVAQITVNRKGSSDRVVLHSDGKILTIYSTEENTYSREAADVAGGNITRDCEVLEAAAFYNPDLLDRLRFGHRAKLIATATLMGVPCRVVQVDGGGGSVWTVYIGPDDLLRGYSQKVVRDGANITRESRVTALKVGPAAPQVTLAWALPKGARSVEQVALKRSSPASGTGADEQGLLPVGQMAPGFSLPSASGELVTLATIAKAHKVTLVNFWSAGCGPCRAELPELSKMLTQLRGQGFDILSLNLGDDAATVDKIWKDGKLTMRSVLHGDKISEQYHIQAIPTNYIVGPDGKILARFIGFDEQGIRQVLAKAGVR